MEYKTEQQIYIYLLQEVSQHIIPNLVRSKSFHPEGQTDEEI